MKKILIILASVVSLQVLAQNKQYHISFMPAVQKNTQDDISDYFKNNLFNKVNQEINHVGCGAVDVSRFVVLINPVVLEKNTTGQLMIYKFDISFSIIDLIANKTYNSFSTEIGGIGRTPGQAAIDACKRFDIKKSRLSESIKSAAEQITDYYKRNCNSIIERANTLSRIGKPDEAIANLFNIIEIENAPCAAAVNTAIENIYKQSLSIKCTNAINEARKEWSLKQNAQALQEVSARLSDVVITNECKDSFNSLLAEIKAKVTQDQFNDMNFKNKVYNDAIELQKLEMNTLKEIAIEYYKSQIPPSYSYNYYDITNNTKKGNN